MIGHALAHLKIGTKVMLIGGLALLGFLASFVAVVITDNLRDRADALQRSAISEYVAVQTIAEDFLNARRREKDFLLRRDKKYADAHDEVTAKIETEIADLLPRIDPGDHDDLAKLQDIYKDYDNRFKDVAESSIAMGLTPDAGLLGKLRTAVHAIEDSLKSNTDLRLTVSMLTMRRHEKDFMARGEKSYVDALMKELAHFNELLQQSAVSTDDQSKIKQLASAYGSAFQEMVNLQLAVKDKLQGMSDAYAAGEPLMNKIREATQSRYRASEDELHAISQKAYYWMLGALVGSAIVVLSLAWLIGQGISRPVARITDAMERLRAGDKTVNVAVIGKDEVARMASAFAVFKDSMIESERLREEQEEAKQTAEHSRKKMMTDLADRFESTVGRVVAAVTAAAQQLQGTAQGLTSAAEEASNQSTAVAAASEEMTQSVESVASATEELSTSIAEIGKQITESSRIIDGAVAQAGDTNAKVQALSEAAKRIGDVVRLINDIAGQTNLLALNATIEAARAGEAGKGFAVVASEVKTLATQTAKATEEIGDQVRAIQEATASSADAIGDITGTIGKVSEISTSIASAVEEQSAATQEISRNVQQTATSAAEVSSNIQGVTNASRLTSRGSADVLSAATELAQNGTLLRHEVTEFLRQVRVG